MQNKIIYPFVAIVGQEDMKLSLILNIINPAIGGVLIRGEKGTAKSTAVRGLAKLLEKEKAIINCKFNCNPDDSIHCCEACKKQLKENSYEFFERSKQIIELPVSATEDRVVGTLDIEKAIKFGEKHFEAGILAKANNNILYVDEVNLLDDHVVDVLLDCAAMGINTVEREGVSFCHPSKFILIGTMNPEEGDLRPQLLDRFGLTVEITGEKDVNNRKEIVKRRLEFEKDRKKFIEKFNNEELVLKEKISEAKSLLKMVEINDEIFDIVAKIGISLDVDGHRADITLIKTAKTLAAYDHKHIVNKEHVLKAATLVLPHRMRRVPFESTHLDVEAIREIINEK